MSEQHGLVENVPDHMLRIYYQPPKGEELDRSLFDENTRKPAAPVDRLTKVPLLISPGFMDRLPAGDWDDNHVMFSRKRPELMDDLGLALRRSRVQRVHAVAHRGFYHRYVGQPEITPDDETRMKTIVLHLAGYIPEKVITFRPTRTGHEVCRQLISRQSQAQLLETGMVRVYEPAEVAKFIGRHVLRKYIHSLPDDVCERDEKGVIVSRMLADEILHEGIIQETRSVEGAYRHLKSMGYMPKSSPKTAQTMVEQFMIQQGSASASKLFTGSRQRSAA